MQPEHETFLVALGSAVVAEDFSAAHNMLADWLQHSITADDLRTRIVAKLRELADEWGFDETRCPKQCEVDEGDMSLAELRSEFPDLPPEVTDENFRQWASIQFLPGDDEKVELDAYFDWWLLLVEVEGRTAVGHFVIEDPD